MKTKKLDLFDFKQNELSRDNILNVKAGIPIIPPPPKPGANTVGSGAGTGGHCYTDFETGELICEPVEPPTGPTATM